MQNHQSHDETANPYSTTATTSKSGRVVIEANDWNVAYAMSLAGIKPVLETFTVTWNVQPYFADEFVSPGVKDVATESILILASARERPAECPAQAGNLR